MKSIFEIQNGADHTLVRLFGDIDTVIVQRIKTTLLGKIPSACARIVVDLSKVNFLDSHGVGLFVSLLKRTHDNKGQLVFVGVDGQPAAVLRMVGFTGPHVSFCADLKEAGADGG